MTTITPMPAADFWPRQTQLQLLVFYNFKLFHGCDFCANYIFAWFYDFWAWCSLEWFHIRHYSTSKFKVILSPAHECLCLFVSASFLRPHTLAAYRGIFRNLHLRQIQQLTWLKWWNSVKDERSARMGLQDMDMDVDTWFYKQGG